MQITRIIANTSSADKYPTRQVTNIKAAHADMRKRLFQAEDEVLSLLESIPVTISMSANTHFPQLLDAVNRTTYTYELSPERLLGINNTIYDIIAKWLEVDNPEQKPVRWFFDAYLTKSYQSGTELAIGNITSAMQAYSGTDQIQMQLESYLFSQPYRSRIELVGARAFNDMVGFAGENAAKLGYLLANGVAAGQSPRTIAKLLQDEFEDISGWRALRIARTEINNAYHQSRLDASEDAKNRLGIELKVMHISALLDSTRLHHAERHGKLYDPQEQREWWAVGANSINCYCTSSEIIFIDGKPLQLDLIAKVRAKGVKMFGLSYDDELQKEIEAKVV